MSTNCTYRFHTSEGQVTIQGMAAMKAFLATNGVGAIIKPPSKVKATARAAIEASAPAQARMSPARAPAFYSQLQRAIEQVPARLSTMAAPQWAQWLKANASKLGVKQDEVTWSGIEDYLKLRGKDKIDSAELAAWVGANGVRVDETSLGDGGREYTYAEWAEANHPDTYKKLIEARESGDAESYHYLNRVLSRDWRAGLGRKRASGSTKYGDYTVPGGTKYRELLLTLPERTASMQAVTDWQKRMLAKYGDDMSRSMTDAEKAEGVALREAAEAKSASPYKSSHWDQRNILAHVRVDERTDADGKRVLFVNELQSDWGQEGRKRGFAQAETARISGVAERDDYGGWWVAWADGTFSGGYHEEGARARAAEGKSNAKAGTPSAPFVTKTEGWLNLALKRIAMLAVEGGYDKVAFIGGKQAADLYKLSNQIDRIDHNRNGDGTYNLSAIKDGREVLSKEDVPEDELEDIVGKEVAQKIVNGDGRRPEEFDEVDRWESEDDDGGDFDFNATPKKTLSGLDLEVGGDGMKGFYDQIVPQAISKLLPRLGGEKLTKVGIPDGNAGREVVASQVPGEHMWGVYDRQMGQWLSSWDAETYASDPEDAEMMGEATAKSIASAIMRDAGVMLDQTGFEVTDKMRDTVLSGVPLFSRERAADAESDVDQTQDKYNQRIEALRELVACLTK